MASGGGQQAPVCAALGGNVTLRGNSAAKLDADRAICRRAGLDLRMEQGDMRDLPRFPDGSFDLIFHPVSNCFADDVNAVWRECYRVLQPAGRRLMLTDFFKDRGIGALLDEYLPVFIATRAVKY